MEENRVVGKKTMGRRKITMKKIEKKSSLQVTFSKRRMGLFRKASQLSLVCGAQIAVLVRSPAKKVFAFGHPSVEAVLDRWRRSSPEAIGVEDGGTRKYEYEEALRRLEMEKNRVLKEAEARDDFWWDESFDDMELQELEEYLEAMEALQANLSTRISEMEQAAKNLELDLDQDSDFLNSSRLPFLDQLDHDQDFDFLNSSRLPYLELDHDQDLGSTSDLDNGFGGGLMQLLELDYDQDLGSTSGLDNGFGGRLMQLLELDHDQDFDFLNSSRLPFLELDHDQDLGSTSDLDNGFGGGLMQFDHDQDFDVGDWLIQR